MKHQRLLLSLTLLNALLLVVLLFDRTRVLYAEQSELPILRGRGLEIVDDEGLVRAVIRVHSPKVIDGKHYGGGALLVMGDPRGAPGVKLGASDSGAGLGLSAGRRLPNGRSTGIEMHADNTRLILTDSVGRVKTLRPQDP